MKENSLKLNNLQCKIVHFISACLSAEGEIAYRQLMSFLNNSYSFHDYSNWQSKLKLPFDLEFFFYEVITSALDCKISSKELKQLMEVAYKMGKHQLELKPRISPVWTGPITNEAPIKLSTYDTVKYLLESAKEEIFIVGYSFSFKDEKIQNLLRCIENAVERNCRINIIVNDVENNFKEIMNHWKKERYQVNVFHWKGYDSSEFTSLHAKLVIIDQQKLLLTSANFSYHGFQKNIETGVIIENHEISKIIWKQFYSLMKEQQMERAY